MLLAFLLLAALISLLVCLCAGWTGFALAGFFLLLWLAAFLAVCLCYALFLYILSLFMNRSDKEPKHPGFYRFLLVHTLGTVIKLARVKLHVEGLETVPEGTFFYAGNHRSGFDPLIAIWVLRKRKINFISKPSNFRLPIVGAFMRKCGFLAINRDDDREALRTILAAAACMKEDRASFGVYPEGTRSKTAEMLPFRNGCFKAAQRAKVPVVVASIQNSDQITKNFPWRTTHVTLRFCGVIDAETVAAMKTAELGDRVRAMLEESLQIGS